MKTKRLGWHLFMLLSISPFMFFIGGCTVVGPDYQAPDLAEQHGGEWLSGPESGDRTSVTIDAPPVNWWEQFDDPELTRLVSEVIQRNLDLAIARERIVEASLRRSLAGADRLPKVNLDGKIIQAGTGEEAVNFQGPPAGEDATLFSAGGFAGWELDLWGRVARLVEAADRNYEAELETYRYVAVSLTGELVLAYIDMRTLEGRLQVLESNIELLNRSLELVELRYRVGNSTELDVEQIRRELNRAIARGPELRRARTVFSLALMAPKWVRAYLPEPDLGFIAQGMEAMVYSDSFPKDSFNGKIGFISSAAEFTPKFVQTTELRTQLVYETRIWLEDPDNRLRLGMPVTVVVKKRSDGGNADNDVKPEATSKQG